MKLNVAKRNQLIQNIDLGQEVLVYDYSETVFLIGRSKECHIVLDDKKISREHARIVHKHGDWFVEKIANEGEELILNGEAIKRSDLFEKDVLQIGQFVVTVVELKKGNEIITPELPVAPTSLPVTAMPLSPPPMMEAPIQEEHNLTDDVVELSADEHVVESEELSSDEIPNEESFADEHYPDSSELESLDNEVIEDDNFQEMPVEESSGEEAAYSLENISDEIEAEEEKTQVLQSFSAVHLELFGETAPYDKFIIDGPRTFIGRDPVKCQIVLNDPEVSTVHAVINKNNVMLTIEDLSSANGTILNGNRINKSVLGHNDEFVIGAVTFTVKFRSEFLRDEHQLLMPVDENQSIDVEEIVEIHEEGSEASGQSENDEKAVEEKSLVKRIWKNPEKRKKLIIGLVVGMGVIMLMPDSPDTSSVDKNKKTKKKTEEKISFKSDKGKKKLSESEERKFSEIFQIGKNHFDNGRYREALEQFENIAAVDPYFNPTLQALMTSAKEGLKKLEEQEKSRQDAILKAEREQKIKDYLVKAQKYTDEHNMEEANVWFERIVQLDPENLKVQSLKREIEAYDKEKKRKELDELTKKKEREAKVEKLKAGKNLFIQKEWYKAMLKLDEFLKIVGMDEDLIKEASEMLKTSKDELSQSVIPLVGKAKSLMEGQDLKGAYEVYNQILKIEPSNAEALNQTSDIRDQLTIRARKVYREAIISESLSLFHDAKEKFQEVQQISPVDSEYYKKATDKLKDFLE